jgi:predicted cupin superfamily sugar epimerase
MNLNKSTKDADFLIEQMQLQPHPEGGYFKESYRSDLVIEKSALPDHFGIDHVSSTAIYFLLKSGQVSKFHRIKQDEMWHFYLGSPLKLILIDDSGNLNEYILSPDYKNGHFFQVLVPAFTWMAAYPLDENSFTLVGCTVAPGFEFSDFTIADTEELKKMFPQHQDLIDL